MNYPITEAIIEMGKSNAGGWNKDQIELLGLTWPLYPGWKNRIIGKTFDKQTITRFIRLKREGKGSKVKSDLQFDPRATEATKRTVNSFYLWMERLPLDQRAAINGALTYIARKNHQQTPE